MKRFKNILIALDPEAESQAVLGRAATLARLSQARLHVLVVLAGLPPELRMLVTGLHPKELQETVERRQRSRLDTWLASLREENIDVTADLEWNRTPFLAIIRDVLHHGHDLVIKVSESLTGPVVALLHPTDRHLMRKCPCPLWMMNPHRPMGYKRIVAAVDPFPDDQTNNKLNQRIMALASSLAALEGAEMHVVNAYRLPVGFALDHLGVDMQGYEQQICNLHRERLSRLLASYCIPEPHIHLLLGAPGEVIPELTRREGVDLIVMGTVARSGIPGMLIGNTAEQILDRVQCDVLAIKPDGFVTPVTLHE